MVLLNIDMPKCCAECPIYNDFYDYPTCNITGHSMGYKFNPFEKRMPSCPLSISIIQDEIDLTK